MRAPAPDQQLADMQWSASTLLALANPSGMMEGDDFDTKMQSFGRILKREKQIVLKERHVQAGLDQGDSMADGSGDPALQELARSNVGGPALLHGLRQGAKDNLMVVDHFKWKLPITELTQCCLASKGTQSTSGMPLADLETQWRKDHELIDHDDLKPLAGENKRKPFPVTACAKIGTCVCGPTGKASVAMCHKLTQFLKQSHPGTAKEPSEERQRYYDGLIVLELATQELDSLDFGHQDGQVLHLHCGYTNFLTWEAVCMRLHVCFYNPFTGCLTRVG